MTDRALKITPLAVLLVLLLVLPAARAQDQAKTIGKPGDVLTPFAVGNQWVYANNKDELIDIDKIERSQAFDGTTWHEIVSYQREKDDQELEELDRFWVTQTREGEAVGQDADAVIDDHAEDRQPGNKAVKKLDGIILQFRYPATLGETYSPDKNDPGYRIEVIAIDEKIKNKAGEFTCVVYKETFKDQPGLTFTTYLAPGVGLVRMVEDDSGDKFILDLIEYKLVDEKK